MTMKIQTYKINGFRDFILKSDSARKVLIESELWENDEILFLMLNQNVQSKTI